MTLRIRRAVEGVMDWGGTMVRGEVGWKETRWNDNHQDPWTRGLGVFSKTGASAPFLVAVSNIAVTA